MVKKAKTPKNGHFIFWSRLRRDLNHGLTSVNAGITRRPWGQDTLKTLQDKQAIHIKKGQPISSSNVWKQAGVRKKETVEKVEVKDEDKAVGITKIEETSNETKKKGWLW